MQRWHKKTTNRKKEKKRIQQNGRWWWWSKAKRKIAKSIAQKSKSENISTLRQQQANMSRRTKWKMRMVISWGPNMFVMCAVFSFHFFRFFSSLVLCIWCYCYPALDLAPGCFSSLFLGGWKWVCVYAPFSLNVFKSDHGGEGVDLNIYLCLCVCVHVKTTGFCLFHFQSLVSTCCLH